MRKLLAWLRARKAEWAARNNVVDCIGCDNTYLGVFECPYCTEQKKKEIK